MTRLISPKSSGKKSHTFFFMILAVYLGLLIFFLSGSGFIFSPSQILGEVLSKLPKFE